jgi:hypothetical protein
MKRNSNDSKPGKKRLAFRKQVIRELTPSELPRGPGAGDAADPAAGTDVATMSLSLLCDGFHC